MPSFDIVSRIDIAEVDNALNAMQREISQRFDFKGSKCSVERNESELTILADDDMKLRQMHELLQAHVARRKIDHTALDYQTPEKAAGQSLRQKVLVRQGIASDVAKQVVKSVKAGKFKAQVAIQGDELRVSGKKRDDLQAVMAHVKKMDLGLPVQFVNMRD